MRRIFIALLVVASARAHAQWQQWGRDPQHTGVAPAHGQQPSAIFADYVYDPFVPQQLDENGFLPVHYQAPLVEGDDAYMTVKSGVFSGNWATQTWNVANLRWTNGKLAQQWITPTDWKPVPIAEVGGGPFFEPVFHPALTANFLYLPASGGTVLQVDRVTGVTIRRINPFASLEASIYVAGPLSADAAGNIYYNAMQFNLAHPWTNDIVNAWLVKITPSGTTSRATYASITPNTPHATDMCVGAFPTGALPWPPSPTAVPPSVTCGSQRPGVNIAPAVASDGTIYTISRAHLNSRYGYVVAVNPNLTPKWIASMRDRLNDGCNVLIPPNGTPGGCRAGALTGVDPSDNTPGAGTVNDNSSSCPVIAPDGSVFYGAYTRYNYAQGHMMHFSATGAYLGAYRFGWDITPAIWSHDASYSLITKENHYGTGSYCNDPTACPPSRPPSDPEQFLITRLSPSLDIEWQFKSTNTKSCERLPNGTITCSDDHPDGFEWCVNAPAVDADGTTYVNSEDGFLYAIDSSGHESGKMFLQLAIGAAYTPLSIDPKGRIYTQNAGHLFVVGEASSPRRRAVGH